MLPHRLFSVADANRAFFIPAPGGSRIKGRDHLAKGRKGKNGKGAAGDLPEAGLQAKTASSIEGVSETEELRGLTTEIQRTMPHEQ